GGRLHRLREPDALLAGLGSVRVPLQQRRRAVRADPGRARHGAALETLSLGHGRGDGSRRALARHQPVGRHVEPAARMVRRQRLAAMLLVGLIALVAASLALLPGIAYWDTGELQS